MKYFYAFCLIGLIILSLVIFLLIKREYFPRVKFLSCTRKKSSKKNTVGIRLVNAIKSDNIGMHGIENHQDDDTSDVKNAESFSTYIRLGSTKSISHAIYGLSEEDLYND